MKSTRYEVSLNPEQEIRRKCLDQNLIWSDVVGGVHLPMEFCDDVKSRMHNTLAREVFDEAYYENTR